MKGLSKAFFLNLTVRDTRAWSQTFLIQVCINSWKKLLFNVITEEKMGSRPKEGSKHKNTGSIVKVIGLLNMEPYEGLR